MLCDQTSKQRRKAGVSCPMLYAHRTVGPRTLPSSRRILPLTCGPIRQRWSPPCSRLTVPPLWTAGPDPRIRSTRSTRFCIQDGRDTCTVLVVFCTPTRGPCQEQCAHVFGAPFLFGAHCKNCSADDQPLVFWIELTVSRCSLGKMKYYFIRKNAA